jgi:hypothetical protein
MGRELAAVLDDELQLQEPRNIEPPLPDEARLEGNKQGIVADKGNSDHDALFACLIVLHGLS